MKEFSAQTGGRYTYIDDIMNLQELSLAFTSIFDGCDAFIISGCEVKGSGITAGYVYLNGKIRQFTGAAEVTAWPQLLYEHNYTETVAYKSGADKVGRTVYSCALGAALPSSPDAITGVAPAFIRIEQSGGLTLRDALFGKYSLLLRSASGKQQVDDAVRFGSEVQVAGNLSLRSGVQLRPEHADGRLFYDGEEFILQSKVGDGTTYKLVVSQGDGFRFFANQTLLLSIRPEGIVSHQPLTAQRITAGSVGIEGNALFNKEGGKQTATLQINLTGDGGQTTRFADTVIGNGKGQALLSVKGADRQVELDAPLAVRAAAQSAIQLQAAHTKEEVALLQTVDWTDSRGESMASVGYANTNNQHFDITNTAGSLRFSGKEFVDLSPIIKEGGVSLTDKYLTIDHFNQQMPLKADLSAVYTQQQADTLFATQAGGLSQFVNEQRSAAKLREEIGALDMGQADGRYATLSAKLTDMVKSERDKDEICRTIGAARSDAFEPKIRDTRWFVIIPGLYARQIGAVVYICGKLRARHEGTMFILPTGIAGPEFDYVWHYHRNHGNRIWIAQINAHTKTCYVKHCNEVCGHEIEINMQYIAVGH